ncbi:uncharacterized protein LOC128891759 [Hylaeus anthracinus]|uniref:uncharacterized protein LOC128891759 n=1 Tax=Hylaeus anthracinus TaxID=313031 RepID=UPI0023B919C1|nr:uncharacterized protein LOC128891759 [Hylaeus anthracinus]XP_054007504.1 uncharacterized protein LOC128891759 [Hylaeus anthracinus]XP_054007513.1 uncharacterized protein LOC128891759 [Hylaeus anthracinus]
MSEVCPTENWRISLGMRNNVLHTTIPYVPMLVENIPIHLSFEDHEENGIKTIQTMGELVPKTEAYATLLSLTPGNKSEFPISFKHLHINDLYIQNPDNTRCAIWDKHTVFKVYGKLETAESETVLEVTHLVPVRDIIGTLNTMTALATIARSECRWYYRTEGQNNMLQSQWDKMKEQKKRLVNVKTS